jgi:hypothetical protein
MKETPIEDKASREMLDGDRFFKGQRRNSLITLLSQDFVVVLGEQGPPGTIAGSEPTVRRLGAEKRTESGLSEGLFEIKSFTIIVAKNRTGSRRLRAD